MVRNELYHYGVKGMKWGVRRRIRTLDKLDRKIDKNKEKATKNYIKSIKKGSRRFQTEISRSLSESYFRKGNKTIKKLRRDIKKREKIFKSLDIILDEPVIKKKGLISYSSVDQKALRKEVDSRRLTEKDNFVELMELLEKKQVTGKME